MCDLFLNRQDAKIAKKEPIRMISIWRSVIYLGGLGVLAV